MIERDGDIGTAPGTAAEPKPFERLLRRTGLAGGGFEADAAFG